MTYDRRNRVPGGTYVFTVNVANRRSDLLVREIETLRAAIRAVRLTTPFHNVELISPEVLAREGRGIWQKRFWEPTIRNERDYSAHMDYIHFNPVKHGLVAHPAAWLYSMFHKCVALGLYDAAWGTPDLTDMPTGMGERP